MQLKGIAILLMLWLHLFSDEKLTATCVNTIMVLEWYAVGCRCSIEGRGPVDERLKGKEPDNIKGRACVFNFKRGLFHVYLLCMSLSFL